MNVVLINKMKQRAHFVKKFIYERDGYTCNSCKTDLKEDSLRRNIDHIIPRSLVAISELWNVELLCQDCNKAKGSILPENFQERCLAALERTIKTDEGIDEKKSIMDSLRILLVLKYSNEINNTLKIEYEDDLINKKKYGGNNVLIKDYVTKVALKKRIKSDGQKKDKINQPKISKNHSKYKFIKKLKSYFQKTKIKNNDDQIKASQMNLNNHYNKILQSLVIANFYYLSLSNMLRFLIELNKIPVAEKGYVFTLKEILTNNLIMLENIERLK